MVQSSNMLQLEHIEKSFGRLRAIDDISFGLEEKKLTILMGPNGSGKTTLINIISGFYKPDKGDVFYKGQRVTGLPPYKLYYMGITRTFQIPSLFWKLNVLENVLVAAKGNPGEAFIRAPIRSSWEKREKEETEKALRLLDILGLFGHADKRADTLSGGQMKLLEMGRALMSGAKLLLLDEPISGVNPKLAHEIFDVMIRLRNEMDLTFLIVEHRLDIALMYVDHVIAMALGKLLSSGTPEQVTRDPKVLEAYLGN